MKLGPVLVSLRPEQWTKNLVLLAALAFSKHLFDAGPLLRALLALALFCGLSGAVYLLNDVAEKVRAHGVERIEYTSHYHLGVGTRAK